MTLLSKLIVGLIIIYLSQRPDAKKLVVFGILSLLLFLNPEIAKIGSPVHSRWGRIGGIAVLDTITVIFAAWALGLNLIDVFLLGIVVHAILGLKTPGNQLILN